MNRDKLLLSVVGAIAVIAIVLASFAVLQTGVNRPPIPPREKPCDETIEVQILKLEKLEHEGKWNEAFTGWQNLQKLADLCDSQRQRIDHQFQKAKKIQDEQSVTQWKRAEGDEKGKPDPSFLPSERKLIDSYPTGKRVVSRAMVHLTGKASRHNWLMQGAVNFAFEHEVIAETEVIRNNGKELIFEVVVPVSAQRRATTQVGALALHSPPPGSVVDLAWKAAEGPIGVALFREPRARAAYLAVRAGIELLNKKDPGLEKTLTYFADRLKLGDQLLRGGEDVELLESLDRLSGQKLTVKYVRDLGVTQIDQVNKNAPALNQNDLARFAYHGSLLLDHYIFPNQDAKPGDRWDVPVAEVAVLVNDGFFSEVSGGPLKIKYENNTKEEENGNEEEVAELRWYAGEIELRHEAVDAAHRITIKPKQDACVLHYSRQHDLVKRAHFKVGAVYPSSSPFSTESLLFGVAGLTQSELTFDYSSAQVPGKAENSQSEPKAAAAPAPPKP